MIADKLKPRGAFARVEFPDQRKCDQNPQNSKCIAHDPVQPAFSRGMKRITSAPKSGVKSTVFRMCESEKNKSCLRLAPAAAKFYRFSREISIAD